MRRGVGRFCSQFFLLGLEARKVAFVYSQVEAERSQDCCQFIQLNARILTELQRPQASLRDSGCLGYLRLGQAEFCSAVLNRIADFKCVYHQYFLSFVCEE